MGVNRAKCFECKHSKTYNCYHGVILVCDNEDSKEYGNHVDPYYSACNISNENRTNKPVKNNNIENNREIEKFIERYKYEMQKLWEEYELDKGISEKPTFDTAILLLNYIASEYNQGKLLR